MKMGLWRTLHFNGAMPASVYKALPMPTPMTSSEGFFGVLRQNSTLRLQHLVFNPKLIGPREAGI
jgi:hypothetical protein